MLAQSSGNSDRRRAIEKAWERFVQDGLEPGELREEIRASWLRAKDTYGVDPAAKRPRRRLSSDGLLERIEHDELLHLAAPILRDFSDRLSLSDHVLACFDAEGWMLSIDGDPATVDRLAEIDFRPGVSWAEDSAGTNGPGTALVTASPVEVFAAEHFVQAWHPFSCAAVPVFQPGTTTPIGVIDLTGPWQVRRRQALSMTKALARAIEERLRAVFAVRDEVVRYAFRAARDSGDAVVAVDRHGRVLAANETATRRRLLCDGALPPAFRQSLRLALGTAGSHSEAELRLGGALGPTAVSPVRYEGSAVGAILRLTPSARSSHPRLPTPAARYDFSRILGSSEPLQRALALARRAAENELPVVITGESGTGKELFAQALHCAGRRRSGPFVAVNCGAIPAALLEAELFGYEAGTFTGGAREGRAGRFEDAHGGTLLLDEVSELSSAAQAALLRILEEREVVRLGTSQPRPVDVRVVAATNRPLDELVRAGRFREDLSYRLNVLLIDVPPLRARGDDVLTLAQVFLAEAGVGPAGLRLGAAAKAALTSHRWPGNVRELRNVMLRAAATATTAELGPDDLHLQPAEAAREATGEEPTEQLRQALHRSEGEALRASLEQAGWSFSRAAHALGIARMTLYRRAKKYGLARPKRGGI
jgi:transcriptional regulator of acetoin/glycerol metabolism